MVHRGAHHVQADRDVNPGFQPEDLHRAVALVVVHGHHQVEVAAAGAVEQRVGRQRAGDVQAPRLQQADGGDDLLFLFAVTEQAVFPGVRVDAADADARLRDAGAVYACACSRAQVLRASPDGVYPGTCRDLGLDLDAEEVSWRLRTSAGPASGVSGAGNFASPAELPAAMRDFVVRKKDGFPAYQLTSVVDDLHYGIDLIVRGQDLWASTLAQYYLSYALGADAFREIRFYHHPLLTAGGGKLSKSAGATSIRYLRRQGMKREDIYALIARFSGFGRSGPAVRNWEDLAAFVETRASRLQS